jgi:serine/threonine protein kinase
MANDPLKTPGAVPVPGAAELNDQGQNASPHPTLSPGSGEGNITPSGPDRNAKRKDAGSASDRGGSEPVVKAVSSLVGEIFDDLELLAEIGRGGMGVVYKARQKSLDRLVAVKLLLAEHFAHPLQLARFQAEARAAACLAHPNIVQVYQIGECRFGHYFTMEYIDGQSLETLVKRSKIKIPSASALTLKLARAVHYAHAKGIVHRDLKPANIVVDRALRPVIMDFGIAKFLKQPSSLTQQGVLMGTPAYMAPEQTGETPDQVGPLADVYALGAILYNLLTGHAPFEDETALRTVLKVIGPEPPRAVRDWNPEVPERLERICLKCLRKRPQERYSSAQHLADALRRFHAGQAERPGIETMEKPSARATAPAVLPPVFLESLANGQKIRVARSVSLIGRASECDIIVRAPDVSKQHCRLLLSTNEMLIEDLGSANGTYVNGQAVDRAYLQEGDRLGVADYEFLVRLEEPES